MTLARQIKLLKAPGTLQKVTPVVNRFLMENPEGVVWDDEGFALFREIVERSKGNMAVDRAGRWGASSRGKCLRKQVFTYLGMPGGRMLEPETSNLFNDGKWRHLRWQMMLVQSGAATHAEWPASAMKKWRLKVSIDALHSEQGYGIELKGDRNMARLLSEGVPEDHNLQMHTMMLVTGYDEFVYVMEDKASNDWREFLIRKDPAIMARVKAELEVLNEHVERRVLPDILPSCLAKEGPYRQCDYAAQCLARHHAVRNQWPDRPGDWTS